MREFLVTVLPGGESFNKMQEALASKLDENCWDIAGKSNDKGKGSRAHREY